MELTAPYPWQAEAWQRLQRLRRQGRLPHALLITGARGLGKDDLAVALAWSHLCRHADTEGAPCGRCRDCRLLQADSHPDLRWVVPEEPGRPIRIDAVRALQEGTTLAVGEGGSRWFILSPADALGMGAANALLKTLEEPQPGVHLLLVTAHAEQLPITIRSRCQRLALRPPPKAVAKAWLQEQGMSDESRLESALALAAGAPLAAREALEADADLAYGAMAEAFARLERGEADPVALAAQWLETAELPRLLDYLAGWLGERQRHLASRGRIAEGRRLQGVLDDLFETRRRLAHNLNAQLALEGLLVRYSQITQRH